MLLTPSGEGDITFRIRSYDGLDYSPVEVRQFKLNLVPPTILVDIPTDGSVHQNGKVLFQGTASDPYQGTLGSDIKQIWFRITYPDGNQQQFFNQGSTSWSYEWNVAELPTGEYTVDVWAADSDFCIDDASACVVETRTVTINNDNVPPNLQLSWIGSADQLTGGIDGDVVRASEETKIIGVARDIGWFRHPCGNRHHRLGKRYCVERRPRCLLRALTPMAHGLQTGIPSTSFTTASIPLLFVPTMVMTTPNGSPGG